MIGYGHPLRGDDGAGWQVARHLAAEWDAEPSPTPSVERVAYACHQLTPELAEPLSRATFAVFVDACVGDEPGRVRCQTLSPHALPSTPGAFTHHITPASLLTWAHTLYGSCPDAVLLTIDAATFAYQEGLSPPVAAALPLLLHRVRALVQAHSKEPVP